MKYIGVQNMVRFINDTGLETIFIELSTFVEDAYKRWDEFQKFPRPASKSATGVVELMPTQDSEYYTYKFVNNHPNNYKRGLQSVVATGMLCEVETGYPRLLSEMTLGTALRTAAISALVAKYLARPNSKTMAMIGNGCQAEFQAHAFKALLGVNHIRAYDRDPKVSEKFAKNMEESGITVDIVKSAGDTVQGADIITTCTSDKKVATVLSDNMVGQGVHINTIGGDAEGKTELQPDILRRGPVFVELEEQTRIEGEIQHMDDDFPVIEIHDVFNGAHPGRSSDKEITIFDSVGFAISDYAILRYLYEKTADTDYYEELEIIGDLDDQRNLFGLLA